MIVLVGPKLGQHNTGIAIFEAPDEEAPRRLMTTIRSSPAGMPAASSALSGSPCSAGAISSAANRECSPYLVRSARTCPLGNVRGVDAHVEGSGVTHDLLQKRLGDADAAAGRSRRRRRQLHDDRAGRPAVDVRGGHGRESVTVNV